MARCIYVHISGGLGNQLYQYAVGRATSVRTGLPLVLDLRWFQQPQDMPRAYGLPAFPIKAAIATPQQLRDVQSDDVSRRFGLVPMSELVTFVRETERRFAPQFVQLNGPLYLRGYWQSPQYFSAVEKEIREEFTFPSLPPPAAELGSRIKATGNSVVVHVRRGDYVATQLGRNRFGDACSPAYYAAAVDRMAAKVGPLSLFVFSDDPDWVRANFDGRGHSVEFVHFPEHQQAAHHDMHLMSLGHHHIIANSTFSWWGAYLARSRAVIVPQRWYANEGPETEYGNATRHPPGWERI
jgi:hypothetical protein